MYGWLAPPKHTQVYEGLFDYRLIDFSPDSFEPRQGLLLGFTYLLILIELACNDSDLRPLPLSGRPFAYAIKFS